jgi:hypothetical protein
VNRSAPADLGQGIAEPFRSDPEFWRSVCASADAAVLLVVSVACAALLRATGASAAIVWAPFILPALFLIRAALCSSRFHGAHEPLPTVVDAPQGELSWRDAERAAVAAVFGRALLRQRRVAHAVTSRTT